jgi:hypothetical protein
VIGAHHLSAGRTIAGSTALPLPDRAAMLGRPREGEMRAVVTGMIATYPVGGVLYDYAQYALGLEQLGFDVYYLEDSGLDSYDPRQGCYGSDPDYGLSFLAAGLAELSPGLARRWHVRDSSGRGHGLDSSEIESVV